MDELFSCRNCIHNCGQSLHVGRGPGYCLKHNSVIASPGRTTCKYLHRKDLPRFVVDEGIREHASEFAGFSALADLHTKEPVQRVSYSERYAWQKQTFDPILHLLAQYYKTQPAWVFVQALSGGVDGRRSLVHASLVRRYMDRCGTWKSSYRLMLAVIHELPIEPAFEPETLSPDFDSDEGRSEALWDVVFSRLAGVQEYGFHSGIESLMWATDSLNGQLVALDWKGLQGAFRKLRSTWTRAIVKHAEKEKVFFPKEDDSFGDEPI